MSDDSHPDDFLHWLESQAALLHARKFDQLDIPNLYEELNAIPGNLRQELSSRLRVIVAHLLKYEFQPSRRTHSWTDAILEQRQKLELLLMQSPSLHPGAQAAAQKVYAMAVRKAAEETGLPRSTFPAVLLYTIEQMLDPDFLPDD
jgi:hypothetical protein